MSDCNNLQSLADFMTQNIFKSSAKSKNSEYCILEHISLIKMLYSRGPKVEPCGTPDNIGKSEENFPKVRTMEDLYDKLILNQAMYRTESP
jgi:hypothetical protein